jgi:AcrR family transcriptional regulator
VNLPAKRRGRPRVEELQERRREEILDAAARVFAARGYPGTEVQVVADELGVGKGTIYRYFPSKEELFLAAADRGMKRLSEAVERAGAATADPLDRMEACIRTYLAFFKEHPEHVELLIQERAEFRDRQKPTYFAHKETNSGPWEETFRALIKQGRVRDVPVPRILEVLGDLVYGTMFTNYFSGRHRPLEEQARDILDIVFHGILTPAERRRRGAH